MSVLDFARRMAAYLVAVLCVWMAGNACYAAYQGESSLFGAAAMVIGTLTLAAGLFCMNRHARRVAAAFSLVVACFLPPGVLNPFAAMDYPGEPPSVTSILSWMVPLIAGLVVLAWLLDPPRVAKSKA